MASGFQRGASPKCRIQLRRAPTTSTTSAFCGWCYVMVGWGFSVSRFAIPHRQALCHVCDLTHTSISPSLSHAHKYTSTSTTYLLKHQGAGGGGAQGVVVGDDACASRVMCRQNLVRPVAFMPMHTRRASI